MNEDEPAARNIEVEPGSVAPLSLDEEAIIEAGRRLLTESIELSRDFAKQMITVSSGAIPIYIALLGVADLRGRTSLTLLLVSLPSLVLLISTLFFVIALLPRQQLFSMQFINDVRDARDELLRVRRRWIKVGLTAFGLGVVSAIAALLALMSIAPYGAPH